MEKVAIATDVKGKSQRTNGESLRGNEVQTQDTEYSQAFRIPNTFYRSDGRGFDLSHVPSSTGFESGITIQACSKGGNSCDCPACTDEAANEIEVADEPGQQQEHQSPLDYATPVEQNPSEGHPTARENPTAESEEPLGQEHSGVALIVEDNARDLSEGQMKKADFLRQLRAEICLTIEPALASAGQTTEGCPYLNYWLDSYQQKDAEHIERTVKKYAPDSAGARTSDEYISIVAQRALQAAEIWARTGKLSGIPQGLPTTIPTETLGVRERGGDRRTVQFKAKQGGAKAVDDPVAIQKELGDGQPLASKVRSRMESAFGMSFSHVRTHTNTVASGLSNRLNARAFTVGNHVAFGNGEYVPGTIMGDALIAHELAHVAQQKNTTSSISSLAPGDQGYDALEVDADQVATAVVTSLWSDKGRWKGIAQRSLPTLRSGIRLQRCASNTANTKTTLPTPAPSTVAGSGSGNACPKLVSLVTQVANVTISDSCQSSCRVGVGCCTTPRGQCGTTSASGAATTAVVEAGAGCTGELAFMQNILSTNRRRTLADGTQECLTTSAPHRDGVTPWKGCVVQIDKPGRYSIQTDDCPNIKLRENMTAASTTESFKTYLLWKPTGGSNRNPIANVNWGWSASTTRKKGTNCATNWTDPAGKPTSGNGAASTDQPVSTPVIQDLDWAACPK